MVGMKWDQSLSVGIDLIDEQHKMLIQRINDLATAVDRNQGTQKIIKTLDFLLDYTEYHFSTEEKHMVKNHYPGYNEHKEAHEDLKVTLGNLEGDFLEEGATQDLAESINVFLVNWLIKHIHGIDVKFGAFLKEQGLEMTEDA